MKNEIKLNGKQTVMGMEIPVIEGGFGEDCKCVTDKMVAEIHGIKTIHVRENINKNLSRFREGIDYIDMKKVIDIVDNNLLLSIGYTKMQISKSDAIYLLSERGYAKLIKIMDSDKAWEIHDILMDEYFFMRKTIRDSLSVVDLAMLKVMKAKNAQERMIAMQEYNETVVQPLQDTIDKQTPMVELAELRIDKKGCYSLTDVTKSLRLKRGQITRWGKSQGYLHKKLSEVNKAGEKFFKVYSSDGVHNQIGVTESGLQYISNNIDKVKKN